MWLLSQTEAIGDQMRAAGLELDPKTLGDLNRAPLNAIVSLGGCSAALLSDQGLIATNHHCVYGSIRYNSSPEHNYCAMARTNIIPKSHDHPKNLMVSVMVSDHHTRAFLWYIKIFAKPNPSRRGHQAAFPRHPRTRRKWLFCAVFCGITIPVGSVKSHSILPSDGTTPVASMEIPSGRCRLSRSKRPRVATRRTSSVTATGSTCT